MQPGRFIVLFLLAGSGLGCSTDHSKPPAAASPETAPVKSTALDKKVVALDPGSLDGADPTSISGWAWNSAEPNNFVEVEVYDGDKLLSKIPANTLRKDLLPFNKGNAMHGFLLKTPAALGDGQSHAIHARVAEVEVELKASPKSIQFKP